jgi:hypothetical protein
MHDFGLRASHLQGADKSLARPGRKHATATEDFDVHISYFNHNWRNISTIYTCIYRGADKSLARPEMKHATATEDFDVHISCL